MQPDLLSLIVQRPVKKEEVQTCPHCGSVTFKLVESTSTLLGCAGDEDPNHYTHAYLCSACDKRFYVNIKRTNMWVTDTAGRVFQGVSNCFENVIYTCTKCGGDVVRSYLNLDGTLRSGNQGLGYTLENSKIVADFQTKWECVVCLNSRVKRGDFVGV